jgi:hypothetical protein
MDNRDEASGGGPAEAVALPLRADTSFSLLTVLAGFVEGYRTENPADHALGA